MVLVVDHRPIGVSVGEERARIDERPDRPDPTIRQVGDHDLLRGSVGEVDARAVAVDGRSVRDNDTLRSGGQDLAAVEHIETAARFLLGIVHRTEPDSSVRIDAGIVQPVVRRFARHFHQEREILARRVEQVKPVGQATQQRSFVGRQCPTDLARRLGSGVAAGRGVEMPQEMSLDIDEPDILPPSIPDDPFAQFRLCIDDGAHGNIHRHPASTQ